MKKATNCRKSSGQDLDDTEFVDVIKHTEDEIEEMIAGGKFQQAIHIMAWLLAKRSVASPSNCICMMCSVSPFPRSS